MRKLVYYVATTLDGFIAHEDGSFDGFVWDDEFVADYYASLKDFDTVLMGRKTYEVGLRDGKTSPYPEMKQFLFSTTLKESPDPQVQLVSDSGVELVERLKSQSGRDIWLCGGASLASQMFAASLVDEVRIKLNPVLFGKGIPLIAGETQVTTLELKSEKRFQCGILVLTYDVRASAAVK